MMFLTGVVCVRRSFKVAKATQITRLAKRNGVEDGEKKKQENKNKLRR